ncbi:MAG: acylneuraminate cytidylyltransferase family protein [Bacteroidia bacterium]|nr:acylneuraminate cytidylyltransferase family protein [Bacteroidia bacterium]
MKILGIIPARSGSKRIPGKNIKPFNGKPLIWYALNAAVSSKLLTHLVVSSDSQDVLNFVSKYFPLVTLINRPSELADDQSPAIDYVIHSLDSIKETFDLVVIIQPSSPLSLTEDIDGTIQLLLNNDLADSAVSVMKLDHSIHPIKMKTMEDEFLIPFYEEEKGRMAAHDLPEIFVRNGAVYASRIATILKSRIIGNKCLGYIMPRERSIDINDPIDFAFAEFLTMHFK